MMARVCVLFNNTTNSRVQCSPASCCQQCGCVVVQHGRSQLSRVCRRVDSVLLVLQQAKVSPRAVRICGVAVVKAAWHVAPHPHTPQPPPRADLLLQISGKPLPACSCRRAPVRPSAAGLHAARTGSAAALCGLCHAHSRQQRQLTAAAAPAACGAQTQRSRRPCSQQRRC